MTNRNQIYKCERCGHIVDIQHPGSESISCCGQKMTLLEEATAETSKEKHVPFVAINGSDILVKVGETVDHPMTEKHFIEWIEILTNFGIHRKYLNPEEKPEAAFVLAEGESLVAAREYCNIHGLWRYNK